MPQEMTSASLKPMATSTVENYLKQLYTLQHERGDGGNVSMGELAASLGVTPGTATSMVKSLAKSNHLTYVPRVGVTLTPKGERMALLILRRHRLVEQFLVKVLDMEWHEIHEEAEALEHAVSDKVLDRIDALLGYPKSDPHGDPIPSAAGLMDKRHLRPLDQCEPGQWARIARIEDQQGDFLQYLESNDLMPGQTARARSIDRQAGVVALELADGQERSLGLPAARKIHVELVR